jgi:hypothetical protein
MRDGEAQRRELLLSVYPTIAARRMNYDTLLWQMPALSLTAQAFLLTIALDPGRPDWARALSSSLALVTSIAALLTMHRFRAGERGDSDRLQAIEERLRLDKLLGIAPHAGVRERLEYGRRQARKCPKNSSGEAEAIRDGSS